MQDPIRAMSGWAEAGTTGAGSGASARRQTACKREGRGTGRDELP